MFWSLLRSVLWFRLDTISRTPVGIYRRLTQCFSCTLIGFVRCIVRGADIGVVERMDVVGHRRSAMGCIVLWLMLSAVRLEDVEVVSVGNLNFVRHRLIYEGDTEKACQTH